MDSNLSNAWLIKLSESVLLKELFVEVTSTLSIPDLQDGDGILLVEESNGNINVIAVARFFRKRISVDKVQLFFDGIVSLESKPSLEKYSITTSTINVPITRLEWSAFQSILSEILGIDFADFPILSGETPKEQAYVRDLLQVAVEDDLLGPANGPDEEIIGMSVRDRYLVGKLSPLIKGDDEGVEGLEGSLELDKEETKEVSPDELNTKTGRHTPGEEFSSSEGTSDSENDESEEVSAFKNQSLIPSSVGFTFCVDGSVEEVRLEARWGRYERTESEKINEKTGNPFRCWKRIPSGGSANISLKNKIISPTTLDENCPEVLIKGKVGEALSNGDRLVTLFLVNGQKMPEKNQDENWVFQPEMIVTSVDGKSIFQKRPVLKSDSEDEERNSLEMIYRHNVEFAVGHGISVHTKVEERDSKYALEIKTKVLPNYEVPMTETPGLMKEDRPALKEMISKGYLDMRKIASMNSKELRSVLETLTNDYKSWIQEQRNRIGKDLVGYDEVASDAMNKCEMIYNRLVEGINAIIPNPNDDEVTPALEAFRFANLAMASQRVRSIYALKKRRNENPNFHDLDIPKNRSWRPFQLAFILLSIPALVDPKHKDRTEPIESLADLLWFPTGGGKTEAYLGVAGFSMAIRRLQDDLGDFDSKRGLSVIMRYTLRLLTIQQFQRATTLICAMETMRRQDSGKWGEEPFTIGLWVGKRVTPNTTEEAHEAISDIRAGRRQKASSPHQLSFCPWCGSEIKEGRDIEVKKIERDIGKTIIYCGDPKSECDFTKAKSKDFGLPISVVDEEIYRRPPSMLIATVDKFARIAWEGKTRTLFGYATTECPRHGLLTLDSQCTGNHNQSGSLPRTMVKQIKRIRPPDLIIQDEFHLISGPLGTMVGLYETAIDELSAWQFGDKIIRPKVIASTATVRKAKDQVTNVFMRKVSIFPPHGLDVEDNFFSVQRSIKIKPGRKYLGICSPGLSRPAILIRVYVALLTASKYLYDRFGHVADPFMTLVGYFNSLRELGGMKRLAEDDVQTRSYRVLMSEISRPGLSQRSVKNIDELTSRVSSKDIPKKLDNLEVSFKQLWERGEIQAIDIVLATNMFSVGVDVNRLGLMTVNGQPKNTSEYIQATSRVGRTFPGLVCTVLTWSRPRDLSHYETFEHYHSTFYKHVEAQSVTPFSARSLDRGLTGATVSVIRAAYDLFNPNSGAGELNSITCPEIKIVKDKVVDRAFRVTNKDKKELTDSMLSDRFDYWVKEAQKPGRSLGYETRRGQGDLVALLKKPGISLWQKFTVPTSMREVESGVRLIIDSSHLGDTPDWQFRKIEEGGDE